MESGIKLNKEIANLIIKLCLSINELKKYCKSHDKEKHICFKNYEDIKHKMDEILRATNTSAMLIKIKELQGFTKSSLKLYKVLPIDYKGRDQTLQTLKVIENRLKILGKLISHQL